MNHFVSKCCVGELCGICKAPASHKVEEAFFPDEPEAQKIRHGLTSYICCDHFIMIMGPTFTQSCMTPKDQGGDENV